MRKSFSVAKKVLAERKEIAAGLTQKLESMLDSFDLKNRVQAVTFEDEYVLLELSYIPGVNVEDIQDLSRTIATAVSSPSGLVEIMTPIPGTSSVGIKVPTKKKGP